MNWTEIPSGKLNGAAQRLFAAFGNRADVIVDRINNDKEAASRAADLLYHGGYESPSVSQAKACQIMGRLRVFGIEDAEKFFGVIPSKRQRAYMAEIPFFEETLRACRDTHILVAYFPMSAAAIRAKFLGTCERSHSPGCYDSRPIGADVGALEWHLIRKIEIPNSGMKTWEEQLQLLDSKKEETVELHVMMYAIVGYFFSTGDPLFPNMHIRTRARTMDGYRVSGEEPNHFCVRVFGAGGPNVIYCKDAECSGDLFLASARKRDL